MTSAADHPHFTTLLSHLKPLVEGREGYSLLDFPSHSNIGDSVIWCGEIALLSRLHGKMPGYVSHTRYPASEIGRFSRREDIIYLHGGGNFGDLWPRYQPYREAILNRYPHHRIIQLPQSLHYNDPANAESARRAIAQHPDFYLMVRDRESEDFAKRTFDCPVILAPDSAFCMDMTRFPRNPAPEGLVALLREDKERRADAAAGHALFSDARIADWARLSRQRLRRQKIGMGMLGLASARGAMPLRERRFTAMAHERVAMGFAQLDQGKAVVTDRLHGHILATLLEKPHVVIDNSYGKIGRFIAAFGKSDHTLVAADFAAAREMANELLTR